MAQKNLHGRCAQAKWGLRLTHICKKKSKNFAAFLENPRRFLIIMLLRDYGVYKKSLLVLQRLESQSRPLVYHNISHKAMSMEGSEENTSGGSKTREACRKLVSKELQP